MKWKRCLSTFVHVFSFPVFAILKNAGFCEKLETILLPGPFDAQSTNLPPQKNLQPDEFILSYIPA